MNFTSALTEGQIVRAHIGYGKWIVNARVVISTPLLERVFVTWQGNDGKRQGTWVYPQQCEPLLVARDPQIARNALIGGKE